MSALPALSSMQLAVLAAQLRGRSAEADALAREPIAIVGLAARLPVGDPDAAEDLDGFWRLLAAGRDAVTHVPASRRDLLDDMAYLQGAFLREAHAFDAPLFRLSRREAAALDPQQRLLLELSWEALERAAIAPDRLRHAGADARVGVYVGIGSGDYAQLPLADRDFDKLDHLFGTGNAPAFAAGRLAYHLGTSGPAMTIETACSSSLTALHLACRALRGGECAQAIVAGVHLILAPFARRYFQRIGALASDGRSKSFAAGADGFGSGEGGVACVLMPLSQAVRQGYHIHALIRGSALSQDGASGGGLTVPSSTAQRQVIEAALADAGLVADDIDYVETHGTGTELGDPIELAALRAVFGTGRREAPLRIGAVKANIGHTEAAAGLCGLTKLVLALQAQSLPPQPPLAALNPHIAWDDSAPSLVRQTTPWPRGLRPRRAGLSAFGLSGTNAHIVVEEAPAIEDATETAARPRHLYTLSARDGEQLAELARRAAADVLAHPARRLADVCYAANVGRARHRLSAAVHGTSQAEISEGLLALARISHRPSAAAAETLALARSAPSARLDVLSSTPSPPLSPPSAPPRRLDGLATECGEKCVLAARPVGAASPIGEGVGLLLTGQGNPAPGAGAALYRDQADFRAAIDRCAELLREDLPLPLPRLLFDPASAPLWQQTRYAQPATVALSWSLAQLWAAWGLRPHALLGHSLGEYTAAALAGMASIEQILSLVAARGALMQERMPPGRMLVVASPADELAELLAMQPTRLALAADNAPRSCVLAGDVAAIEQAERELDRRKLRHRRLQTEQAFHSPQLDDLLDELSKLAARVDWQAPHTPVIANLDGGWHEAAPDASYWARHARQPVLFRQGLASLFTQPLSCFLELGPRPVLSLLGQAHAAAPALASWCCSLDGDDWSALLESAAVLHRGGITLDWQAFERPRRRRRVAQSPSPFVQAIYRLERPMSALSVVDASQSASGTEISAADAAMVAPAHAAAIRRELRAQVAQALGEPEHAVAGDRPFVEMGADSVVLSEAMRAIQLRYGVKLGIRQLLGELNTLDRLAAFLAEQATPAIEAPLPSPAKAPSELGPIANHGNDALFQRQLDLVKSVIDAQLASLAAGAADVARTVPVAAAPLPLAPANSFDTTAVAPPMRAPLAPAGQVDADPRQRAHFAEFSRSYIARTAQSKRLASVRRDRLADVRAAAGFRPSMKELIYPITGDHAAGARLWDVDGNEYIDISMDFGVNLFGHGAPFLRQAAAAQLERGLALGPRSGLAGDCAELLCELTGMDRVLFCQSGSESVMTAVRLARLHRGRDKIAIFRKSYHGHFDGFLGDRGAPGAPTEPAAPGITQRFVDDLLVLDYASEEALREIARHADGLAAVLVEPVQSRNVDLQPREFLQRLRELTARLGIVLIFDEMISGFRSAPGGAQQLFDVRADLVTYGKTIGGGVPMAALAARGDLLDGIDGGIWRFGDDSAPNPQVTFFAGTFNNHPLGLSLCHAVLTELKARGPAFQQSLSERTARLTDRLNQRFEAIDAPLRMIRFGSIFRFKHPGNLDLLYHHLLHRGLFVWEGRNCFLCDAHGEAELEAIVERTSDAVQALRQGGYLAPVRAGTASPPPALPTAVARQRPLSDQQKQIWIAAQLDAAGAPAYVEAVSLELDGLLDDAALRAALARLAERHEALRTTIDGENDRQTVHPSLPINLDEGTAATPQAWLAEFQSQAFALEREGPLQVGLLRLPNERCVLAIRAHHALIDGLSLGLLLDELSILLREPAAQLPAPVPFSEHLDAVAQIDHAEAERFWHGRIADAPPPLPLSVLTQGAQSRWRGKRLRLPLPAELGPALTRLAAGQGCTVFVAALATTLGLLHAVYDREDVLIGIAAHGRREDHQRMVGQAAQLLPWRSRLSADMRFEQLLEAVDAEREAIGEHQRYPLARLLEPLLGDARGSGAINLVFNLDHARHGDFAGLTARLLDTPVTGAKFELSINLIQARQGWLLDLDYSSARYTREQIEHFGRRWIDWAIRVAHEPRLSLREVVALPAAELARVRDEFASAIGTASPQPPPFIELFQRQLANAPDAIAIRDGEREFDYATLDRAARALARQLLAHGAGAQRMVAVMLPRSAELVAAALGVFYADAAILPLSLDDPSARRARIFEAARPLAVVLDPAEEPELPDELPRLTVEWPSVLDPADAEFSPARPLPDQLAYVIHTSGSTGQPKGAACGHGGLARFIACFSDRYALDRHERVLLVAPPTFDASIMEICLPLALGGRVVVAAPEQHRDPQYLAWLIASEQVSFGFLVPAMLDLLARQPEFAHCDSLRHLLVGGDVLHPDVRDAVHALGLPLQLHNAYGPTETTIIVSDHACEPGAGERVIPIGRANPGNYFRIVDSRQRPVGIGVEGELLIGGEQVGHGYLGDSALSAERFITDPLDAQAGLVYRSGDRACWREDGAVLFLGRADQLVKLRGQRLELGEIETALRAHPRLRDAVVDVIQQSGQGQRLVAWCVPCAAADAADATAWRDDLRAHLASHLPGYMLPADYLALPQLPLNINGKVDRRALPPPLERVATVREASPLQRKLLDYLANQLELPLADLHENFFAAGGHSLAAAKLVSWVRQQWRIELSLKQFLESPTVAGLAVAIKAARGHDGGASGEIIPIRSREHRRVRREDAFKHALAIEAQILPYDGEASP